MDYSFMKDPRVVAERAALISAVRAASSKNQTKLKGSILRQAVLFKHAVMKARIQLETDDGMVLTNAQREMALRLRMETVNVPVPETEATKATRAQLFEVVARIGATPAPHSWEMDLALFHATVRLTMAVDDARREKREQVKPCPGILRTSKPNTSIWVKDATI